MLFNGVCYDGQLFLCPFISTKSFVPLFSPSPSWPFPISRITVMTLPPAHAPRSPSHWRSRCHRRAKVCCRPESPGPHPRRGSKRMPASGSPSASGCAPAAGIVRWKHWPSLLPSQNLWDSCSVCWPFLIPHLPYLGKQVLICIVPGL